MIKRTICVFLAAIFTVLVLVSCASTENGDKMNTKNKAAVSVLLKDELVADDISFAKSNTEAINKAIKNADENTVITLSKGSYYVENSITFHNKKGVTLRCENGTKLINSSYAPLESTKAANLLYQRSNIFRVENCTDITVEGFILDYISPSTADGVILSVENGKTYFKVYDEITNGQRKPVKGTELCFSVLVADKDVFYGETWLAEGMTLNKEADDGVFSVPCEIGKKGDRITCRISCGTYASPAVYITDTDGFNVKDVACRSCPSAFIYAPFGNSNFDISGLKIKTEAGSERLLASNEDSIHIKQLRGYLRLSDSSFEGLGDDALNIHTKLLKISEIDGTKAVVTMAETQSSSIPESYIKEGDIIEFFTESGVSLGTAKTVSFKKGKIGFDAIPDGVYNGCLIQNVSGVPETTVTDCDVSFGRARGFLFQTKKASVSECTFENLRLSAILVCPDFTYWYEGGYTEDMVIENNEFINCASLCNGYGVVHVGISHDNPWQKCDENRHKNVTVTGNSFVDCKSEYIKAVGVENLKK